MAVIPYFGERWERLENVAVAVKERVVPGFIGLITTELSFGMPHQYRRYGVATNDAPTRAALSANEGRSSVVTTIDTIRYGKQRLWLRKTRFTNPENQLMPLNPESQIMGYEQLWQESTDAVTPPVIPPPQQ